MICKNIQILFSKLFEFRFQQNMILNFVFPTSLSVSSGFVLFFLFVLFRSLLFRLVRQKQGTKRAWCGSCGRENRNQCVLHVAQNLTNLTFTQNQKTWLVVVGSFVWGVVVKASFSFRDVCIRLELGWKLDVRGGKVRFHRALNCISFSLFLAQSLNTIIKNIDIWQQCKKCVWSLYLFTFLCGFVRFHNMINRNFCLLSFFLFCFFLV